MKKLKTVGTILNKKQQKSINGGKVVNCYNNPICPPYDELACIVYGNTCHYLG
ncbi:hypothetical protein [uncultured Aquimarina sp.]|uniref:hypothetical protein n=1 Tax=uncultured Aquimarina sp. TaxID=575652 RepID=UPI002615019D|nr:hypothetical protein [uncultured Aquimarina sp.]